MMIATQPTLEDLTLTPSASRSKTSAVSPSLTTTINITDQVSFPIMIKYDTKKANLFGFLSVQYAMGSSGSKKSGTH